MDDLVCLAYAPGYLSVVIGENPLGSNKDEDEEEDDGGEEDEEDEDDVNDDEEKEDDEDDGSDNSQDEAEGSLVSDRQTEWCFIHHCLKNDRHQHMIGASSSQVSQNAILAFPA